MPSEGHGLPVMTFASQERWEEWLAAEHEISQGVWLKLAKKGSGAASVSRQDAIDTALCYGWIDGQLQKFDGDYWLVRFTPRRPGSKWSQLNRARALKLMAESRMRPAGMREVQAAKADGRWDNAYASQSSAEVPDDFRAALEKNEAARRAFETLDRVNRYAVLYRIHSAKKPETRARRIKTFVEMLGRGETIHPRKANRSGSA